MWNPAEIFSMCRPYFIIWTWICTDAPWHITVCTFRHVSRYYNGSFFKTLHTVLLQLSAQLLIWHSQLTYNLKSFFSKHTLARTTVTSHSAFSCPLQNMFSIHCNIFVWMTNMSINTSNSVGGIYFVKVLRESMDGCNTFCMSFSLSETVCIRKP